MEVKKSDNIKCCLDICTRSRYNLHIACGNEKMGQLFWRILWQCLTNKHKFAIKTSNFIPRHYLREMKTHILIDMSTTELFMMVNLEAAQILKN
jgi:hypothetical protein